MANKFVVFQTLDPAGVRLSGVRLDATSPHGDWTQISGVDGPPGYVFAHLAPGDYQIHFSHPSGLRADRLVTIGECTLTNEGSGEISVGLIWSGMGSGGPILPLRARGAFIEQVDGTRWTAVECTDFQLFQRYLAHEDLTPILSQRRAVGFNLLRVLGMCDQLFPLNPRTTARYYDQLADFADLCASYGCWTELVAFADATRVMPSLSEQQAYWKRLGAIAAISGTVLLELVNENDQPINTIDATAFLPIEEVLCSHGSNGSQQIPVRPWWGYETFHTNDAVEWQRKVGHNAMELSDGAESLPGSGVPVIANENTRCPDRFNSPQLAFDAAAGAALLCAGSCFHSVHGKSSALWMPDEIRCANGWVAGARSVPLEFQAGTYRHAAELETPDVLRAYQRILSDGRAHTVLIHKAA